MIKTVEGAKVLGEIAVNCRLGVVACYPITPTTHLTEELSKYYADGKIPEYVTVESEFSAISALVGASAAGSRTFTTTGGQGLLLMHEVLFSLKNPAKVIARSPTGQPLFSPKAEFERHGFVSNVVFPTSAIMDLDGKSLLIYSGAADTNITVRKIGLKKILGSLE